MEVTRHTTVNVSADKVWGILGNDFNDVSKWASIVIDSEGLPDLPKGSGRVCNVQGTGKIYEKIYDYDEENRKVAFILEGEKMPFFMQKIDNTWSVKPTGENQSELQVHVDVTMMPVFKQLMSGMLKKQLSKQADGFLDELKYYAENGTPKA